MTDAARAKLVHRFLDQAFALREEAEVTYNGRWASRLRAMANQMIEAARALGP